MIFEIFMSDSDFRHLVISLNHFFVSRLVQTEAILLLKSISEIVGSDMQQNFEFE